MEERQDLISRQVAIDALDEIRHALWEIDIPSPTVPEYVEHHEQVQSVWKLLDKKQKELYALPSAQPQQTCEYWDSESKFCALCRPSAQPEPCEDAVSRRRLLNDLKELIAAWKKYPVMTEQIKGVEVAIGYVERIPSVTPKRKTRRWIHEIVNSYTEKTYCSECGKSAPFVYVSDDYYGVHAHGEVRKTDFCPHCGADMRGDNE